MSMRGRRSHNRAAVRDRLVREPLLDEENEETGLAGERIGERRGMVGSWSGGSRDRGNSSSVSTPTAHTHGEYVPPNAVYTASSEIGAPDFGATASQYGYAPAQVPVDRSRADSFVGYERDDEEFTDGMTSGHDRHTPQDHGEAEHEEDDFFEEYGEPSNTATCAATTIDVGSAALTKTRSEGDADAYAHDRGYSSEQSSQRRLRLPPAHRHPMLTFCGKKAFTGRGADSRSNSFSKQSRGLRQCDQRVYRGGTSKQSHVPSLPPAARAPTPQTGAEGRWLGRCTVYCCAMALELVGVYDWQSSAGGRCRWYKDGLNTVVHSTRPVPEGEEAHCFFFSYGCVVMWGMEEEAERMLVAVLKREHSQEPLIQDEVDDFGFVYTKSKPSLHRDVVQLSSNEVQEKLAVSFALAQSAKLGVFEVTVEKTIEETRHLPERMAKDGKIRLKRADATRQIGQLFVDRASINLHSDILEYPDFFWEDDEWLHAYTRVSKYLEVERRVEVLNKRLDIIKELFDMLANELHNSHSSMLEWIVIVLILVEVFFQVLSLILNGSLE